MVVAQTVSSRNNPWINSHNMFLTIVNNGNTDFKIMFNPGQVAQYVIGYMSKAKITVKFISETVDHIINKLPKDAVWMERHVKWLVHRIASAMVAGQTVSA